MNDALTKCGMIVTFSKDCFCLNHPDLVKVIFYDANIGYLQIQNTTKIIFFASFSEIDMAEMGKGFQIKFKNSFVVK